MEQEILDILEDNKNKGSALPSSWDLKNTLSIDHEKIIGGLMSLEAREFVKLVTEKVTYYTITEEGKKYSEQGTPEFRILKSILASSGTKPRAELEKEFGKEVLKVGLANGMKKMFKIESANLVSIGNDNIKDTDANLINELSSFSIFDDNMKLFSASDNAKRLKKRQVIESKTLTYFKINEGSQYNPKFIIKKADLKAEDLASGSWKLSENFKELNLEAKGKMPEVGGLHPLLKLRSEFRQTLLEMGFQEMTTNNYVESSFWNFDSLFQPQQHPARDAHDTFFLSSPQNTAFTASQSEEYVSRVKRVHECGTEPTSNPPNGGSKGWRYDWSINETCKNVLRTHTTAVSSRYLHQMAEEYRKTRIFKPRKLFSIDRVFRNESLDATHLAEFHQVEGLIIGRDLGLAQLKTFIRDFFKKIGITKLRFKPAYNPYTEPSMEIMCEHPQLGRVIEIGNSGVFRPEMLAPMGWPADVCVIAWGLSLERPAMIRYECSNIRELVGYKVDSKSVKESPVVSL